MIESLLKFELLSEEGTSFSFMSKRGPVSHNYNTPCGGLIRVKLINSHVSAHVIDENNYYEGILNFTGKFQNIFKNLHVKFKSL